jgi:asparagine synthase (glutamine-hydrolysing)
MSVQFGRWNFEGQQATRDYITKVGALLARYGPDSDESYAKDGITILYRAFQTTKESRREIQPHISRSGAVLTWDGRLDNRAELLNELATPAGINSTDIEIVATAYEKWGVSCFGKLIGDWALSIYNPTDCSLVLAKDPIGPRHLYYSFDHKQVTWSSILDPLVLLTSTKFTICEEYIAGWFSAFPATHLTPYLGIHAVPPSSCAFVKPGTHTVRKYWDFDPSKKIRYRTDGEYEEHFRGVFTKAIQRRLRSDTPVLAELSGGRDSSSIVCMADAVLARGEAETPRLDTISYYDDSEPNWDERPYLSKVEEKRGRPGWHIDVSLRESDTTPKPATRPHCQLVPTPAVSSHISAQLRRCLASQGNRVILSGVGGDEVMGGAPVPTPELQDSLASAQFGMLARQLKAWALQKRKPWFHLFIEATLGLFPPSLVGVPERMQPPRWLQSSFVNRHWAALAGYPRRIRLLGPLPSFQDSVNTLDNVRRQLAGKPLPFDMLYDKSYPYLDRSLLEFMYAIPREQSVRPSQRRSLMRRALTGIVPSEILNRKRKAFVARAPLVRMSTEWAELVATTENVLLGSLGMVDSERVLEALKKARRGEELYWASLLRAIHIESWLRYLRSLGIANFETTGGLMLNFRTPHIHTGLAGIVSKSRGRKVSEI